jgi:putative selenate reductase molybdopterin-binding subunit
VRAAQKVAEKIRSRAAKMLSTATITVKPQEVLLVDRHAVSPDGRSVSLAEVALNSLHHEDQEQIMGVDSFYSPLSPPPFAAQFAEVTVDIETGQVVVDKLIMAVDSGVIVNPLTASGQVEGGMAQALGYAVCEEMKYDEEGRAREVDFRDYHIFAAHEMPELQTLFVETFEPSHPYGVKAVAEIPLDGVAPAIGNAVLDACGADVFVAPVTPERVWQALQSMK